MPAIGPWEALICMGVIVLILGGLLLYWMIVVFRGARRR
jgi:hypothetical protein